MSDQFSVHRNPGRSVEVIPFVIVIQCNRFRDASQRVVVPLVSAEAFGLSDSDIAPHLVINGIEVVFAPLQITNVASRVLVPVVASLADNGERIIRARDALLSRARRQSTPSRDRGGHPYRQQHCRNPRCLKMRRVRALARAGPDADPTVASETEPSTPAPRPTA